MLLIELINNLPYQKRVCIILNRVLILWIWEML